MIRFCQVSVFSWMGTHFDFFGGKYKVSMRLFVANPHKTRLSLPLLFHISVSIDTNEILAVVL